MSIETLLKNLTLAVEANTAAIHSLAEVAANATADKEAAATVGTTGEKTETKPKAKAKAKAKAEPQPEPEAEEATPEPEATVTHDDLKELLGKIVKASNDPKAPREFLKGHGFAKLSDIPDDKVVALFGEAQELYDQAG